MRIYTTIEIVIDGETGRREATRALTSRQVIASCEIRKSVRPDLSESDDRRGHRIIFALFSPSEMSLMGYARAIFLELTLSRDLRLERGY